MDRAERATIGSGANPSPNKPCSVFASPPPKLNKNQFYNQSRILLLLCSGTAKGRPINSKRQQTSARTYACGAWQLAPTRLVQIGILARIGGIGGRNKKLRSRAASMQTSIQLVAVTVAGGLGRKSRRRLVGTHASRTPPRGGSPPARSRGP